MCLSIVSPLFLRPFYPVKYQQYVDAYANKFGVDPLLVYSIIKAESQFNPTAVSKKGAKGLMQVTDSTGEWAFQNLGKANFSPELLFEPEQNIEIGTWYIAWLRDEFNGDLQLVISAYNCGHGRVKQWLADANVSKSGDTLDRIPFLETEAYTKKVLKYYKIYKLIY